MNGGNLMDKDPFKEYIKQSEPNKRDKGYAWHTAIGLQAVDGLKTSKYLIDTAIKNIEGDISIDEAQELLNTYYEENPKADTEDRTEEADKVAVRIAKILSEKAFSFTPNEYISIHKKLFAGIYGHAGKLRDYNITKKEWVLNGATVLYGSASELRATLDYDFAEEKKFSYKNLSMEEIIHHLAIFISRLWQIHMLFMSVGYILPKSIVLLNIIGFLIFFSQGAFNMTMIVMLNNTIEYDEVRFHERHDSIISAVRSFATKLVSVVDQAVVALILIISNIYAISQKISGLEIKAGIGELTSENVIVQADKFIQTADAGQRFILRLGIVAVPVISIGAAYILIKRKYIIDERKYEELVEEIKSTNKK